MNKKEGIFNDYCSIIIGHGGDFYNDLNPMAEVVEKLIKRAGRGAIYKEAIQFSNATSDIAVGMSIKQAFRDFIISTMENKDE